MRDKDVEIERARERLTAVDAQASDCDAKIAVIEANIKSSVDNMEQMLADLKEQESRTGEISANIDGGRKHIGELDAQLKELAEKESENANVLTGCRMKLQSRENALNEINEKLTKLQVDGRSMDGRINMLTEMEKDFEGFSKAVKTVMREKGRDNLRGIHAPVANLIRADDECALAIETALGAAAQNIVVDSQRDGSAAIELLKRLDGGRATFLPVDTIHGTVMANAPERDPGFVGIAYNLVKFDKKYDGIIANLLGRTVIAEALPDAVRMSKNSGNSLRIVTLDGQLINAGGSMTGGSSAKGTGVLSRANELEKLKKQREKLRESEKEHSARAEKVKSDLAAVKYQLDMALEDQTAIKTQISSLQAESRATESSVNQLQALLESLTGDSEARKNALDAHRRRIEDFKTQKSENEAILAEINAKAAEIKDEIAKISASKMELESKRTRNDKETQQRNADIIELERCSGRIEQKKLASEMEEKQILDKLWDNYELSHSDAEALRQPVESLAKLNKSIAEKRREIGTLGNPNIGSIEEFERVNTRYEFLTGQRDDVEKAKKELLGIISDITVEMTALFKDRFKEIDSAFRQTFLELFGGGKAALVLEDENDVLNCGIEIKVQPPGKALSTISLLSGGEMAFVAIALYFAILKVRPTPFCVMDEIDAALDEANVGRYASYMRRMSDKTQFLVITHRRGTMEEADMLYGVTMQEKGVSGVIGLDLESAKKTVEE